MDTRAVRRELPVIGCKVASLQGERTRSRSAFEGLTHTRVQLTQGLASFQRCRPLSSHEPAKFTRCATPTQAGQLPPDDVDLSITRLILGIWLKLILGNFCQVHHELQVLDHQPCELLLGAQRYTKGCAVQIEGLDQMKRLGREFDSIHLQREGQLRRMQR